LKVKWPNDLLVGNAKVAGILIEGESRPVFSVAVGIGVNCITHPSEAAFPATNLDTAGSPVAPDVLFTGLVAAMQRRLAQWNRGEEFAGIRRDWLERAIGLGEILRVRLPERELAGRFEGLDESGRLLLEQAGSVTAVSAGEVFGFGGS
jgi:BirA family biotin operon repressor/biotin-[acetyl-CoA-carboxylase] ligase